MNPDLQRLHPYPFARLRQLVADIEPADQPPVSLSIGEPRHAPPDFVRDTLAASTDLLDRYPATPGTTELRETIAAWLGRRFAPARPDPATEILPVNGTREALFSIAQALVDSYRPGRVLMPNPFYQIYEGAALLAGAEPYYLPCTGAHGFRPDFSAVPDQVWDQCQLLFLCTPGNPTGAVHPVAELQALIRRAQNHDFVIVSDECYSEIHGDNPPPGLLQAAAEMGHTSWRRCLAFHSLSKRSNLPGLRSGFVAGDASLLEPYRLYRTYHGCAMPLHHQQASMAAWNDEAHVADNRAAYQRKFARVLDILGDVLPVSAPEAGFYLWPETPVDDETFTRELLRTRNVRVLPGRYLARTVDGFNPGANRVRLALVDTEEQCAEGARRIRELVEAL